MSVDRRLLPRTFGPWFGRFPGLTRVQQEAIPLILTGRDVLLCSATASGKTEAYAAPAAEIVLAHGAAPASVLIVSPTRALANDLKRRLEAPMSLVDVPFGRYTGEHKERSDGQIRSIAIVTPEALDSLLSRRPSALAATRLVVVDEVHVLDGTPRGDQLRVLLHRLTQVSSCALQRVAASATVDRPQELAARYLVDPAVVVVPGARKLVGRGFDGRAPEQMRAHLDTLLEHGLRKVLVFCRSRNQVETLSSKLAGQTRFGDAVFAHHGSLARDVRERTERHFLAARVGVCFATLTLEMGIDIGTVDYVLLADVPSDVASLLQRIGRGGRRGDTTRFGFVVTDPGEDHVLRTMARLGKEGTLASAPYGFRPSVLVQQALVLACAGAYVRPQDVDAIVPPGIEAELGPHFGARLLEAMSEEELVERSGAGRFVPSAAIELRYEYGTLHSNIADEATMEVVDRITGDIVGHVQGVDTRRIELGGRNRDVVHHRGDRILTDATRGGQPARFRPNGSPSVSLALGRAVVEGLGVEPGRIGVLAIDGKVTLVHGLGTLGALFLLELLARRKDIHTDDSGPYVTGVSQAPSPFPRPTPDDVERFVNDHAARLARLASAGPWSHGIPEDVHRAALRRMTGLDEIAVWLQQAEFQPIEAPAPEVLEVVMAL